MQYKFAKLTRGVPTLTCRLRFSWNFQDSKTVVWKDTQAQHLLPECIFLPKHSVTKLNGIVKTWKNCHYIGNVWKYRKILKISALDATFRCLFTRNYIGFKLHRKKIQNWTLFLRQYKWISAARSRSGLGYLFIPLPCSPENFKKIWSGQLQHSPC